MESHNLLSLNLAHDVATGKLDATQAREKFSEAIGQEMAGEKPAYLTDLRFEPAMAVAAGDADEPTIAGAPKREPAASGSTSPDAKVLAAVVAVDEGEIAATSLAVKKDLSPEVKDYAKMIHDDHIRNLKQTIAVGREIEEVPVETSEVDQMRVKHAGSLSSVVARDGEDFEKHFIDMMVQGHTEALAKIEES
jgi:putative membrane protein